MVKLDDSLEIGFAITIIVVAVAGVIILVV